MATNEPVIMNGSLDTDNAGERSDYDPGSNRDVLEKKHFVELESRREQAVVSPAFDPAHECFLLGGNSDVVECGDVLEVGVVDESEKTNLKRISLPSSSCWKEWSMDRRGDVRRMPPFSKYTRRRGTVVNKLRLYTGIFTRPVSATCSKNQEGTIINDNQREESQNGLPGRRYSKPVYSSRIDRSPQRTYRLIRGFIPSVFYVILFISWLASFGHAFSSASCSAQQCSHNFTRALDHDKVLIGPNLPYCTLLRNYGSCLNRTSRSCRGDLQFHSLYSMVMKESSDHNCAAVEQRRTSKVGKTVKSVKRNLTTSQTEDSPDDHVDQSNTGTSNGGRCLFPYQHQKGSGYRYCSMFGDPHLRTFEGQYETCRTLGAWPLLDNSYFGIQVTNDPVADGFDASGISKVTLIVKSLPGCSDQKTYEATKDSLPSTFVDGTTNSGHPSTDSISGASYSYHYGDQPFDVSDNRPAVLIRTLEDDRHVEIHLRYISTRVVIHRVGNYLTVAVKIPEEVLFQRSTLNSLQICLTGCPSTERINYKEVLAYPDYYVRKWGARNPSMNRDNAVDICRESGLTDFFFDSCVFDLLMTGDESFKESASAAMNDIRHLYPPYRKHYETGRTDLSLYNDLARLGKRLESEERQHVRREPPPNDWSTDHRISQRKLRTSGAGSATVSVNTPFIAVLLLISAFIQRIL